MVNCAAGNFLATAEELTSNGFRTGTRACPPFGGVSGVFVCSMTALAFPCAPLGVSVHEYESFDTNQAGNPVSFQKTRMGNRSIHCKCPWSTLDDVFFKGSAYLRGVTACPCCSPGDRCSGYVQHEPRVVPGTQGVRRRSHHQHQRHSALRRNLVPGRLLQAGVFTVFQKLCCAVRVVRTYTVRWVVNSSELAEHLVEERVSLRAQSFMCKSWSFQNSCWLAGLLK